MPNKSLDVFAATDDVRCVVGSYNVLGESVAGAKARPFIDIDVMAFKTFNKAIKPGDICVVPSETRHKFTTVKIEAVDIEPDFDNWTKEVHWIVDVIDRAEYDRLTAQEKELNDMASRIAREKRRAELRKELYGDKGEDVKKLPIVSGGTAALSPPMSPQS